MRYWNVSVRLCPGVVLDRETAGRLILALMEPFDVVVGPLVDSGDEVVGMLIKAADEVAARESALRLVRQATHAVGIEGGPMTIHHINEVVNVKEHNGWLVKLE